MASINFFVDEDEQLNQNFNQMSICVNHILEENNGTQFENQSTNYYSSTSINRFNSGLGEQQVYNYMHFSTPREYSTITSHPEKPLQPIYFNVPPTYSSFQIQPQYSNMSMQSHLDFQKYLQIKEKCDSSTISRSCILPQPVAVFPNNIQQRPGILHPVFKTLPLMASAEKNYTSQRTFEPINRRRGNRFNARHLNVEEINYDKVTINIAEIGWNMDTLFLEKNPVARLFNLFGDLAYYTNARIPEHVGVSVAEMRIVPRTLNIRNHVKQALRKCKQLVMQFEFVLNAIKLKDIAIYTECEKHMIKLSSALIQLEFFATLDMEHQHNEFITHEGQTQSKRLEICIKELCDIIRDCHVYIYLNQWLVEREPNKAPAQIAPKKDYLLTNQRRMGSF